MSVAKRVFLSLLFIGSVSGCGGGDSSGGSVPVVAPVTGVDSFKFSFDSGFVADSSEAYQRYIQTNLGAPVQALNAMQPNIFNGLQVPVIYRNCGVANAFYSPANRAVSLCDELTNFVYNFFLPNNSITDQDRSDAVARSFQLMTFVAYHEVGHALDDISGVSVGGNFESVADAIGVVLSVKTDQPLAPINGAIFFLQDSAGSFADEHGSGADRAGDMLCWTVGSSSRVAAAFPQTTQQFVDAGRDCIAEFANQYQFVKDLLPDIDSLPPVSSLQKTSEATAAPAAQQYADLDKMAVEALTAAASRLD